MLPSGHLWKHPPPPIRRSLHLFALETSINLVWRRDLQKCRSIRLLTGSCALDDLSVTLMSAWSICSNELGSVIFPEVSLVYSSCGTAHSHFQLSLRSVDDCGLLSACDVSCVYSDLVTWTPGEYQAELSLSVLSMNRERKWCLKFSWKFIVMSAV